MKLSIVLIGVVILVTVGYFIFRSEIRITNYPPQNERIVAFGDSLVAGQGATKGNDFVTQLGNMIGRPVTNLGVGGDTTADGVLRMEEVTTIAPGVVILLLGGNDTLRRIPLTETEENLRTLIRAFLDAGSTIVLVGTRSGILSNEKDELYEALSEEFGLVYVSDILDGIFLKPELMADGIHPNDSGYAIIAERIASILEEHSLVSK